MSPTSADRDDDGLTRRRFLEGSALVPIVFVVGACGTDGRDRAATGAAAAGTTSAAQGTSTGVSPEAAAEAGILQATPACDDGDEAPTHEQTEGPYFKPDSPERSKLIESGVRGPARLSWPGACSTPHCRPGAGALLDFWQADADGEYDNEGFGCAATSSPTGGRYRWTVVPGLYPGRTRHIHVKVQAPDGRC